MSLLVLDARDTYIDEETGEEIEATLMNFKPVAFCSAAEDAVLNELEFESNSMPRIEQETSLPQLIELKTVKKEEDSTLDLKTVLGDLKDSVEEKVDIDGVSKGDGEMPIMNSKPEALRSAKDYNEDAVLCKSDLNNNNILEIKQEVKEESIVFYACKATLKHETGLSQLIELKTIKEEEVTLDLQEVLGDLKKSDYESDEDVDIDDVSEGGVTKKQIQSNEISHKKYVCSTCGKQYKQSGHMRRHERSHEHGHSDKGKSDTRHHCSICQETFTRHESLKRHVKKLHTNGETIGGQKAPTEFKHKCTLCGKKFKEPQSLPRHIRLTHEGEKSFKCDKCDKRFTQGSGLQRHMLIHEEKKFECKNCGKTFARSFVLRRHLLTHTDDKPYKCFVCSKGFIRASQLSDHVWNHRKDDRKLPLSGPLASI
ncbi:zinc finger and SCAN domain-containing protein 12 [Nematostella vectensis]|nr:zinc finger and SCAN domain-containing protein 12 [Nematostella vectensis]